MTLASHEKHKEGSKGKSYTVAVIVASTSRYRKFGDAASPEACEDESGKIIRDMLTEAGHKTQYRLLPDDEQKIQSTVAEMIEAADAIVISGGTGLAPADVTIEAVTPMLKKIIPGFGELFRLKSYEEVGTASVLSRAIAGTVGNGIVFCIPGSPNAAKLALKEIILPELSHIVSHARKG